MSKIIMGHSKGLVDALKKSCLLPDNTVRVIVDVQLNNVVRVYYECLGDERILEVDVPGQLGAMMQRWRRP